MKKCTPAFPRFGGDDPFKEKPGNREITFPHFGGDDPFWLTRQMMIKDFPASVGMDRILLSVLSNRTVFPHFGGELVRFKKTSP